MEIRFENACARRQNLLRVNDMMLRNSTKAGSGQWHQRRHILGGEENREGRLWMEKGQQGLGM